MRKTSLSFKKVALFLFILILLPFNHVEAIKIDEVDLNKPAIEITGEYLEELKNIDSNDKKLLQMKVDSMKKELDKVLEEGKIPTNSGINLYSAYNTKKIHILSNAIVNTQAKIDNKEQRINDLFFVYNHTLYPIERISGYKITKELNNPEKDLMFHLVYMSLNSLEVKDGVFNDTNVFISPFNLERVNGFAYSKRKDAYIASHLWMQVGVQSPDKIYYKNLSDSVNDTLLHELGHIFEEILIDDQNYPIDKKINEVYSKEELLKEKTNIELADDWDKSLSESFAEDFKVFFSNHLGEYSYETHKRTIYKNSEEINAMFKDYLKV